MIQSSTQPKTSLSSLHAGEIFHQEKRIPEIQGEDGDRWLHTCRRPPTAFLTPRLQTMLSANWHFLHSDQSQTSKTDGGLGCLLYCYLCVRTWAAEWDCTMKWQHHHCGQSSAACETDDVRKLVIRAGLTEISDILCSHSSQDVW